MSRSFPAVVGVAAILTLAACGGGGGGGGTASSPPSSRATTTTSATPATSGAHPAAAGTLPAVSNATDLQKEPRPAPGRAPAPATLEISDLVVGHGSQPTASSTVEVQYVGADYTTGKIFDSSWQRGQPASFSVNGVIPGFGQAILGMRAGGRREVVIPPALGYGATGSPPAVAPNETLVFIIDLLAVR
jgi:peptidylprolyl isomerase